MSSHYTKWDYVSAERFSSFHIQINEALFFNPTSILEVGVGSNIVRSIFEAWKTVYYCVDIEEALRPNILGSVITLPIKTKSVDVVICCQVLEHLPFALLEISLRELSRVALKGIVLSIPDVVPYYYIDATLPLLGHLECNTAFNKSPVFKPQKMNPAHYWEIGRNHITCSTVKQSLHEAGFLVRKSFRNKYYPYHHFFVGEVPRN